MFCSHAPGCHAACRGAAGPGPRGGRRPQRGCGGSEALQKPRPVWRASTWGPGRQQRGHPTHQASVDGDTPVWGCPPANWAGSCPSPPPGSRTSWQRLSHHHQGPPSSPSLLNKGRQRHLKQLLKRWWKGSASLYLRRRHCVISLCTIFQHYPLHCACQQGAARLYEQMWWWAQRCWVSGLEENQPAPLTQATASSSDDLR